MKKFSFVLSTLALALGALTPAHAIVQYKDLTSTIPVIDVSQLKGYDKVDNVAHYGGADWTNAVGIARNVSLQDAKNIADKDSKITYFFFVKGGRMTLNAKESGVRSFGHGDAVFFSGKPWWGSAEGLADGYVKQTTKKN